MAILDLKTQRLRLRAFQEGDISTFQAYRSDPEVAKYQGWEAPYSREDATQFVQEMMERTPGEPGQWYQAAIELKSNGRMIGDCAFKRLGEDVRQAEIGITIAREFQGRGYGVEAIAGLLGYLFGELELHRARANIDPENAASRRVLEKLGFRHEGTFVESLWYKGRWADEAWYAILEREWEAGNAKWRYKLEKRQ